jgi:SurA N-terminal domain
VSCGPLLRCGSWIKRLCFVVMLAAAPGAVTSEVLDRIVAAVGGQAITLSDLRGARALGLVESRPDAAAAELPDRSFLDRLVERELMRAEVDRFDVVIEAPEEIAQRLEFIRARFPSAEAFEQALDRLGMSRDRLHAWIEDDLRIEHYVEQRFGGAAQPTDEEALQYFQSREREFLRDGQPRPYEEVREDVRRRLTVSRRNALVQDWVAGLRRRTTIALAPERP